MNYSDESLEAICNVVSEFCGKDYEIRAYDKEDKEQITKSECDVIPIRADIGSSAIVSIGWDSLYERTDESRVHNVISATLGKKVAFEIKRRYTKGSVLEIVKYDLTLEKDTYRNYSIVGDLWVLSELKVPYYEGRKLGLLNANKEKK